MCMTLRSALAILVSVGEGVGCDEGNAAGPDLALLRLQVHLHSTTKSAASMN